MLYIWISYMIFPFKGKKRLRYKSPLWPIYAPLSNDWYATCLIKPIISGWLYIYSWWRTPSLTHPCPTLDKLHVFGETNYLWVTLYQSWWRTPGSVICIWFSPFLKGKYKCSTSGSVIWFSLSKGKRGWDISLPCGQYMHPYQMIDTPHVW